MRAKQQDPRKGKQKDVSSRTTELFNQLKVLNPKRTDNILKRAARTKANGEKNPTRHEKMFMNAIKKNGCDFEFQCIFMNSYSYYCTDFYIPSINKVVEIDGSYHDSYNNNYNDVSRTNVLINENGVKSVVRFTNDEVEDDATMCVNMALGIVRDDRHLSDVIDFNSTSMKRGDMYNFFPSEYVALIKDKVVLDTIVRRYSENIITRHKKTLKDIGIKGDQLLKASYLTSLASVRDICSFNVIDEMMHIGVRNFFEMVYRCIYDDCKHILKDYIKDEDIIKPVTCTPIDKVEPILGKSSKNEFNDVLTKAINIHSKPKIK